MRAEKKILTIIGLVLIILTLISTSKAERSKNSNNIKTMEDGIENLRVNITNITWEKIDGHELCVNHSMFDLRFNFTIYNPNDFDVVLTFPGIGKNFLANISIELKKDKLETFIEGPGLYFGHITNMTFTKGITNRITNQIIGFNELGLYNLPDGKYLCNIYAFTYGEPWLDSSKTMMIINNGTPNFDFNYIPTNGLSLSSFLIIFSAAIMSSISFYTRSRQRKKSSTSSSFQKD